MTILWRFALAVFLCGAVWLPAADLDALPNKILQITPDGGRLWVSTARGLIEFDKRTGTWALYEPPPFYDNAESDVWTACVNPDGSLYVGTLNDGLLLFRDGEWSEIEVPNSFEYFRDVQYGPDGSLWVMDSHRLHNRKDGIWQSFGVIPLFESRTNQFIAFQADGTPWVLGTYGVSVLDGDAMRTVLSSYSSGYFHYGIAADSLGWMWTTRRNDLTLETTLVKTSGTDTVTVGTIPGPMYCLTFDRHGTLWGGGGPGVGRFDGASWAIYDSTDCAYLANDMALDLLVEDDGTRWVGMKYNGLLKFDGAVWTHYDIDPETVGVEEASPSGFALSPAFPNPFNPATTIAFTLPELGRVRITVHDITGRKVAVLADGVIAAGRHEVVFDGAGLASGVYFCRIQAGNTIKTGKMLLMK